MIFIIIKNLNITQNDGYVLSSLNVDGNAVSAEGSYTFTNVVSNHTISAIFEWQGWNSPVLAEGLTPVNWNGSAWTTTTKDEWDYDYNSVATATHSTVAGNGNGKWANAQTADGSLYVWIPRYTYKITTGNHSSGNSWNSLGSAGSNKIEIKFTEGTADDTNNSYKKHPAFTFGTDELTGIWVAKYEASQGNTTSEVSIPTASSYVTKSIPGVTSWRSISVNDAFNYAYNTYRDADSHLIKNVEWGAIAYLTNAIGRTPYINNNSDYITGIAGSSQDASASSATTNSWNTTNGVKASTTHNVYGIYDLSGGSWEFTASYLSNNTSSYVANLVNAAAKYKNVYSSAWSSSTYGDAIYETSSTYYNSSQGVSSGNASWDSDFSYPIEATSPVVVRSGSSDNGGIGSGIFAYGRDSGAGDPSFGFRTVLALKEDSYTITFNANGGQGAMSSQEFVSGVAQNLFSNTFTREGYTFSGWATTTSGPAEYLDGESYIATSNITLYAQWAAPNTHTIIVRQGENGTITPGTSIVNSGENITFTITPSEQAVIDTLIVDGANETVTNEEGMTYTFSNVTTSHTITATFETIELGDIPVGAYISYTPGTTINTSYSGGNYTPSTYTSGWKVFKNNNGQIDIISAESVGTLRFDGANGYANIVYILNKISEGYVNSTYATRGRSLGSTADWTETTVDSTKSLGKINISSYPLVYNAVGFPYKDLLYNSDCAILNTTINGTYPLRQTNGSVWIATRDIGSSSVAWYFYVKFIDTTGNIHEDFLVRVESDGSTSEYGGLGHGVRPIISLKSGLKVVRGNGLTVNTAYVLSN